MGSVMLLYNIQGFIMICALITDVSGYSSDEYTLAGHTLTHIHTHTHKKFKEDDFLKLSINFF